jgi:C1A family cysteine protease
MLAFIASAALALDTSALDAITDPTAKFGMWSELFGATGSFEAFEANDKLIAAHNDAGNSTYTLGHNQFSGLTLAEFKATYLSAPMPAKEGLREVDYGVADVSTLASSVDWVKAGAVTPVKNQGQCGSCWAFSATGALEGAFEIAGHALAEFSEQELVDCSTSSGNQGCNGGLMDNGFKWIEQNGGLCSEADYKYSSGTGHTGSCRKSTCTNVPGSAVTKITDLGATDSAMVSALAKQPVAIAIEADQSAFQLYKSGVLTGSCGTSLDHGVLAVGYGTQAGTEYYKVKNS